MAKKDKIIAWILMIQGILGFAYTGWLLAGSQIGTGASAFSLIAACAALIAGICSLNQHRWAMLVGILVFAAQTLILTTPLFAYYIWFPFPFHLDIKITLTGFTLGINLVGLFLLICSVVRYKASNLSFNKARITNASG